jgi:hypothetical protein
MVYSSEITLDQDGYLRWAHAGRLSPMLTLDIVLAVVQGHLFCKYNSDAL